jgi:hypothetical protein
MRKIIPTKTFSSTVLDIGDPMHNYQTIPKIKFPIKDKNEPILKPNNIPLNSINKCNEVKQSKINAVKSVRERRTNFLKSDQVNDVLSRKDFYDNY